LVLALDTATSAVVAGVAELTADGVVVRAQRVAQEARRHGELLVPSLLEACAEAGVALRDAGAVVVGVGPGPFTGLRVGMVTAAALGDALDVPVHGVGTLDAIAHDAGPGPRVAVTDARRREVYWAAYAADGARTAGPHVDAPAVFRERIADLGVATAAGGSAAESGLPVRGPAEPSVAALVAVAADALRAVVAPGPLEPLYLRRPDAAEPGARKRVRT
jgi:tRNA threonylcarbamoyl adenosine modification protein YeaZ